MPRTFIRQSSQIRNSDLYDDTLDRSLALTAENVEEDLNYLRSQLKYLLGQSSWYLSIPDHFDLTDIHDKRFTYLVQKTDDVTVPNGQNYVALTGITKPSANIAIGAATLGGVVAQLAGAIGSNDTTTSSNSGNVLEIRDAATNSPLTTGGNQIYGLLQVGSAATDGNPFGDAGNDQAQISFVYLDPVTDAWTACPVVDIEDAVIEYAYRTRTDFYNLPEGALDPTVTFIDSTGLDLQDVYDNSVDGKIDLTAAKNFTIDLNGNADAEIVDGATEYLVASQTDTALKSGVDNWLLNESEQRFYDAGSGNYVGFKAPSSLAGDQIWVLPAADGLNGQVVYTDGFGNLAWKDDAGGGVSKKAWRILNALIAANTPIDISTFTNPDSMVFGTVASDWQKNYDVYVNGVLQLSATSAAINYDCYWLSNTTLAFEYNLKNNDVITIIQRK